MFCQVFRTLHHYTMGGRFLWTGCILTTGL